MRLQESVCALMDTLETTVKVLLLQFILQNVCVCVCVCVALKTDN